MKELDELVMFYIKYKTLKNILFQGSQIKKDELENWLSEVFDKPIEIVKEYYMF